MEAATRKEIHLEGLCCPNCAKKIERGVCALPGVSDAVLDFANQRLTIDLNGQVEADAIVERTAIIARETEPDIIAREIVRDVPSSKSVWLTGVKDGAFAQIESRVAELDGVASVILDAETGRLTITALSKTQLPSILRQSARTISSLNPGIKLSYSEPRSEADSDDDHATLVKRVGLGIGVALFIVGLVFEFSQAVELVLFLISYLLIGGEVVIRAVKNIAKGQVFDENFLMSLATIGAFAIGEYPEGVAVMLFYQIGEAFQEYAVGRSRRSITSLMDIRPDFANLRDGSELLRVPPEEVGVGDVIIVKPGEKVPLDGIILEGRSALDTSALTGEALPRDVEPGAEVLSGSINKSGLLTISVTKEFGESTVSKILDLVQNATGVKAPIENFITKFARYYTPAVVFAAVALAVIPPLAIPGALFSEWLHRALVFLVVSCPCALVISIPMSYFGGIGGASRSGILVKGSNYLDALNDVGTVVFDKTGTLTKGVFAVSELVPVNGFHNEELLELAAHAESGSNHPIAVSILNAYGKPITGGRVENYEELAGHGVRVRVDGRLILAGNGKLMESSGIEYVKPDAIGTVVYLAVDGGFAGYVVIADEIKPDSKRGIERLRDVGVKEIVMLSGDAGAVGERVGRELGIDRVYAELLPHQKVEKLEGMLKAREGKGKIAFVGDGINDAPALARADVGIAMGGVGSDAAIEAADVVLMTDEPSKIAEAIGIAKRTRGIVMQNIVFALAVKAVILGLGAAGIATMWAAVFGDVGVALLAVLNAMRTIARPRAKA
ncbi:cadmium-translocating P-type ATPase [Clostridia bacterium]|nr:cadmium-translocating P-type ATPase [Clostridia bacterium]